MSSVEVHPRISAKHPDVSDEDVITAWCHAVAMRYRNFDPPVHRAAAGLDTKGRFIEMLGVELEGGGVLIYHAMKLTPKMADELELG